VLRFYNGVYCVLAGLLFLNGFILFIGPGTVLTGLLLQDTVVGTVHVRVTDPAGASTLRGMYR
jgi:hypothetical protein